jgi:hypothetical protein
MCAPNWCLAKERFRLMVPLYFLLVLLFKSVEKARLNFWLCNFQSSVSCHYHFIFYKMSSVLF